MSEASELLQTGQYTTGLCGRVDVVGVEKQIGDDNYDFAHGRYRNGFGATWAAQSALGRALMLQQSQSLAEELKHTTR